MKRSPKSSIETTRQESVMIYGFYEPQNEESQEYTDIITEELLSLLRDGYRYLLTTLHSEFERKITLQIAKIRARTPELSQLKIITIHNYVIDTIGRIPDDEVRYHTVANEIRIVSHPTTDKGYLNWYDYPLKESSAVITYHPNLDEEGEPIEPISSALHRAIRNNYRVINLFRLESITNK